MDLFQSHTPTLKPAFINHYHDLAHGDGALAFWLANYSRKHSDTLVVMITPNQHKLNELDTLLSFFGVDAHVFADYETLVYDRLVVQQDIISERIALLTDMPTSGVLLVSVQTMMQRIVPPSWLLGRFFDIQVGEIFNIAKQTDRLIKAGYVHVENVFEPGEFAVRGGVVDIFAMGQVLPFRLDLFDEEVESIKFFDTQTQRTISQDGLDELIKNSLSGQNALPLHKLPKSAKVDSFKVLPAQEFSLEDDKERFRQNFASLFEQVSARKFELYNDVMSGIVPAGIEYYAPLFFDMDQWLSQGSLFHYLPDNCLIVSQDDLLESHQEFYTQIDARYQNRRHDKLNPILAPHQLYLPSAEFFAALGAYPRVSIGNGHHATQAFMDAVIAPIPDLSIDHQRSEPLEALLAFVEQSDVPVLLVAESAGRREIILELLKSKLKVCLVDDFADFITRLSTFTSDTIALTVWAIDQGVQIKGGDGLGFCVVSESQLFGRQVVQARRRRASSVSQAFLVKSVTELTEGSLVVHIEHGIGRYQGLMVLDVGEGTRIYPSKIR